jgi:hypothetical protein
MHAIAINLAWAKSGYKTVPIVIGAIGLPLKHQHLGRLWG